MTDYTEKEYQEALAEARAEVAWLEKAKQCANCGGFDVEQEAEPGECACCRKYLCRSCCKKAFIRPEAEFNPTSQHDNDDFEHEVEVCNGCYRDDWEDMV